MLDFKFYSTDKSDIVHSKTHDLYQYTAYIGENNIVTSKSNSYWYIDNTCVKSYSGESITINSSLLCVEIIGYTPENRSSTFSRYTDLPYINGCSSKQLLNPVRAGDPTWQMLYIPPHTSEQAHHIHSTTRIVYIASGSGKSHIGSSGHTESYNLRAGMVLIIDKMIPHHFSTQDDSLIVLPLHIFSSTSEEHNHPMFLGTYRI
jgi:mannose-6-phosphate isomerase-like protein (cupin superfamily)